LLQDELLCLNQRKNSYKKQGIDFAKDVSTKHMDGVFMINRAEVV
jgi:hypothetical protein